MEKKSPALCFLIHTSSTRDTPKVDECLALEVTGVLPVSPVSICHYGVTWLPFSVANPTFHPSGCWCSFPAHWFLGNGRWYGVHNGRWVYWWRLSLALPPDPLFCPLLHVEPVTALPLWPSYKAGFEICVFALIPGIYVVVPWLGGGLPVS